jgi:hypothetical protein
VGISVTVTQLKCYVDDRDVSGAGRVQGIELTAGGCTRPSGVPNRPMAVTSAARLLRFMPSACSVAGRRESAESRAPPTVGQ